MTARTERTSERYRVNLSVRYGEALDFVIDYAENLSEGGLFVRGAHHLDPKDKVKVEIDLPGFDQFQVLAEVAHVLTAEEAESCDRNPGAGFRIVRSPDGFAEALHAYLVRLGRRRDVMVLSSNPRIKKLLDSAGYRTGKAQGPKELKKTLEQSDLPVAGVVVSSRDKAAYVAAAEPLKKDHLIHAIRSEKEFDELLAALDAKL